MLHFTKIRHNIGMVLSIVLLFSLWENHTCVFGIWGARSPSGNQGGTNLKKLGIP